MSFKTFLCTLIFYSFFLAVKAQEQNKPVNFLFIAVDDLRTDLGIYGNAKIHSPNIDALGRDGVVYKNHYVSVPTCGASRYSLLTGLRPRSVGDLSNAAAEHNLSKKPETEKPETFIHHFKRNGYRTVGIGKISHSADGYNYGYLEEKSDELELPHSWDEMLFNPGKWGNGWNAFFGYADGSDRNHLENQTRPLEHADVEDTGYPDGLTAELAVQKLGELAKGNQPFFLGVGFFKPHLPFNAPQKYWDLYDEKDIDLAPFRGIPENVNLASMNNNGEFNQYLLGKEKAGLDDPLSDEYARELRHAYFSAVSYVDAQVGKVVDELKRLGLYENTVIILWGDHGWHLGDQNMWGKHTIFESALKSPLIIKAPQQKHAENIDTIVETVDIYPTLLALAGLATPYELDGQSLISSLEKSDFDPSQVAYSYFKNGITMRTPAYRITKYFRKAKPVVELYDQLNDPNERINIAAQNPELLQKLLLLLEKGNTGLYAD